MTRLPSELMGNPKRKLSSIEVALVKRVTAEIGEDVGQHMQCLFDGSIRGLTNDEKTNEKIREFAKELGVNLRHSYV